MSPVCQPSARSGPDPVVGVQHDPFDVDAAGLHLGGQVGHQRRAVVDGADTLVACGQGDVAAADQHDVALLVALDDLGDEPAGRVDRGQQGGAGQQLRGRGGDLRRARVLVPQHRAGGRVDDDAGELGERGVGQLAGQLGLDAGGARDLVRAASGTIFGGGWATGGSTIWAAVPRSASCWSTAGLPTGPTPHRGDRHDDDHHDGDHHRRARDERRPTTDPRCAGRTDPAVRQRTSTWTHLTDRT